MNLGWFSKFNFEQFRAPKPILPTNGHAATSQPSPILTTVLSASTTDQQMPRAGNIGSQFSDKAKIYGFASGIMIVLCVVTFAAAYSILVRPINDAEPYPTDIMDGIPEDINMVTMTILPFHGGIGFGGHYTTQDTESMTSMVLAANTANADALSGSLDQDAITATGTLTLGTQIFVLVDSTIAAQALTGTDLYAPLLTDTSYAPTPAGTPQHKPNNNFCVNGNDATGIGPCTTFSTTPTIKVPDVVLPA